ncbi:helix-turn-helix transcriptional regulator [Rudanella lutea]|uniref:helix-turn-helix transcriptional regulator n=1 Tax=Rudanella lutea TaxID=451374 RepID=UPI00038166A2|nr:WYL domain-containing protein [Rudanella lutea]
MLTHPPAEQLRRLLDTGESFSLQQLQQLLDLGDRQIRRLLDQLRQSGIPIEEHRQGKHKRVSLPTDRQRVPVPDLRFDTEELRALAIAAKASRAVLVGTPHVAALKRAFDKLLEHARPVTYVFDLDEPMQEWHFAEDPTDQFALDCFRAIEGAMDERQSVRIDYLTAKDNRRSVGRKVDPYCFIKRGRAWILVAFCHKRQKPINFSMTRVSRVELCPDAYFDMDRDFDAEQFFRASLGAINDGECYLLQLLVEPDKALFFRERQYHPTQLIEEERPDGRLVVSYELEGFEEMRSFCQGWGVGITVLTPDLLRERLRDEAKILLERYR